MWAFFFSCTFCVLPMNAKGVFIVCVYQKVYWLLILNITHHLCSAPSALHHRHTHTTALAFMVSTFLLAVCPAEITHQSKRWSRQLLTKGVLFLCSAPSALHYCHTSPPYFVSERFFLVYPYDYLLNVKIAQKSILCVWEVFLCCVLCVLLSACSVPCELTYQNNGGRNSKTKRRWVFRATTPSPHIITFLRCFQNDNTFTTTAVFRFWAFYVSARFLAWLLNVAQNASESLWELFLCCVSCWVYSVPCVQNWE